MDFPNGGAQAQPSKNLFTVTFVCAMSLQTYLTLRDPTDYSPPGSSFYRILQARILEWVASPSPGDPPDPGIKPTLPAAPALQADSLPLSHRGSPTLLN